MPIAKMKRLQVLALERDHDALLRQLERMGCVEISEPDAPDAPESLRRCDSETADCLARQRQVQTAIDALRRAAPPKKAPLLAPRPAIGEAEYLSETGLADGLALARQVNEAAGRLQQLTALAAQLETDRITLGPWLSLDLPLELTETRCCDVTLGVLPPFVPWDELCGQVQNEYPESELHLLSADRQQQCVLLITHKAATAPVLELLRGRGFAASPLKGRTGTPEENRRRDTDRLAEVKRQQEALRKQLDELAERLPELYLCADRLASRLQREENRRRLLTDGCIVAFDGWVPEKKTARLTAYLDTAGCDYTLSDPTTEQIPEVPVLLEDNAVARSMNCITEVIGMALPGNGTIAAVDAARIRLAKKTGMRVVELVREGLTPEKIMTESAFRNALCLDMALGCSTNTVLHLPAIAHEAGIDFDLNWVNEASAKVPNLCHLAPAGHHHVIDLHLA